MTDIFDSSCNPSLVYKYSDDGNSIVGVSVGTKSGNTCDVEVPITFPGTASVGGGASARQDIVGTEPLIYWTKLSGSEVQYVLGSPIIL